LALAKVECAALSVLEKHDSFAAMSDYLTVSERQLPCFVAGFVWFAHICLSYFLQL